MLQNEAQLAGILGHEVTHVVNRHSYLENRSARKKMATANIFAAVGGAAGGTGRRSRRSQPYCPEWPGSEPDRDNHFRI